MQEGHSCFGFYMNGRKLLGGSPDYDFVGDASMCLPLSAALLPTESWSVYCFWGSDHLTHGVGGGWDYSVPNQGSSIL